MLSLQDEACKLEFRSEKFPYHSVRSHSFFSNNFARKRNGKIAPFLGRLLSTFHKKKFFSVGKKNSHVNVGYCFLISVMFHLSRLKYCFWSLESFNPLTAEWALRALIDFTLSNARRFNSSMWNPLDRKGLSCDAGNSICWLAKRHEAARICIQ